MRRPCPLPARRPGGRPRRTPTSTIPPTTSFPSPSPSNGSACASAGRAIINYKHYYPENARDATHCEEAETEVSSAEEARRILLSLGFQELVVVRKERASFVYGDFEVSPDSVEGLGLFAEVEALRDFGGTGATRAAVFAEARSLGIDVSKRDLRGYPYLLLEKAGLLKGGR